MAERLEISRRKEMNADEAYQLELEQQRQDEERVRQNMSSIPRVSYGNLAQLYTALAKAQAEITGAKKDSANPFFKSKYADLASCWDACRDALTSNGLAVIQMPYSPEDRDYVGMETILCHESGESITSRFEMPIKDHTPQSLGSTLTYARRYSLAAMVGIAQVDDDAEKGMARNKPNPAQNWKYAENAAKSGTAGLESWFKGLDRDAKKVITADAARWDKIKGTAADWDAKAEESE